MATKETLFSSTKPEDKVTRTNRAARNFIQAEDDARRSKTERLRAARLQMEADKPEEPAAPTRKVTPAAQRKRRIKV